MQISRPSADISNNGWTPGTGYYLPISELVADDSTLISSGDDPAGQTVVVKLSGIAWPAAGDQTLTVRLRKVEGGCWKSRCQTVGD